MNAPIIAVASSPSANPGRSARMPQQLWQVPTFLVGLCALLLVAAASPFSFKPADNKLERDLALIRLALEKPGPPAADIVTLADTSAGRPALAPPRAGEAHFLLGTVFLRLAERSPADRAREEREKAGMHLELAELRGVGPADRARLTYLRGKLLFQNNGDLLRTIELLSSSLPDGADNVVDGYGMLTKAHLRKPVPDLEAALAANLKQLEFCEEEAALTQVRLQRGELLLRMKQRVDALKVLDQAAAKAAPKLRLQIRLLQAGAAMQEGLWGRAIPWWNELLAQPESVPGGKGRVYYQLGVCLQNFESPAHDKDAAAAWQAARLHGGDEAQAAALRLGELQLYSNDDRAAALEFFAAGLNKVCVPNDFKNALIDLAKARELLERACRTFNEQHDAEHFLRAAELYKKLAPPGAAEEKIAQAAEARGLELLAKASKGGAAGDDLEKARTALQQAALAYDQAAETRPAEGRADALWRCIECYQLAKEPVQAIAGLKKFVELPLPAERKAEAWYALAEIQRSQKVADARDSYKRCVAFNSEAFTAKALLHLADMALEQQELKDAEDVLLQVAGGPASDRTSHEQALLKLANLYFQQGQLDKAAIQCKELMKQYPAHPSILSVREQLGECYRNMAKEAQANIESPEVISQEKKQLYGRVRQECLEQARDVYQQLADELEGRAAGKPLSPLEDTLRRKASFVVADCYYDLPNWFEVAHDKYTKLFDRYRDQPDALWACQRLVRCLGYASNAKYGGLDGVRETAEAAVEYCLQHLEDYERLGAFRNAKEKADWFDYLERARSFLREQKRKAA